MQDIKFCNPTILDDVKKNCQTIIIAGHKNPDGDCLGGMLALAMTLKKYNKDVYVIADRHSQKYDIIPGRELIYTGKIKKTDVIITVDSGSFDNTFIDVDLWNNTKLKINIDHHVSNTNFADYNHVFRASSASEVMFNIVIDDIDKDIATALYVGIVDDTGGFKHPSTTVSTHLAAAELLKHGIAFSDIYSALLSKRTFNEAKAFSVALDNLNMLDNYPVSYTFMTESDMQKCGVTSRELDGIVNFIFDLKNIEVAVFIYNREDSVKVSFRSKGDIDVSVLAKNLGGGGHKNAAGCLVDKDISEAVEFVLLKVKELFE